MTNNTRKNLLFAAAALTFGFSANAQSLDEGIKMVQYERYTAAKTILQPMAASNAMANYYLGITEVEQGNTEAAKAIFAKYPDDAANMAGMARVQYAAKNNAEGFRLAQAAAAKAKKKDAAPLIYAADAINYSETDDQTALAQAAAWYKTALEKNDNVDVRIGLGDVYRKIPGNGGAAMTNYQAAVAKDPANSLGYTRIGRLWYATRQNYTEALDNYQKAKTADPKNPLPYRYLADAYNKVGKPDLAEQNVDEYYKLSDKSDNDKILLANIKYQKKDYASAIATGEELIASGNKKPSLHRLLGWSYYENKDYAKAKEHMNTFFATEEPKNIVGLDYLYAGRIDLQTHQWDAADQYFTKAVAADTSREDRLKLYKMIAEEYQVIKSDTAYSAAGNWYGRYAAENPAAKATDFFQWGKYAYYGKKYDVAEQAYSQMQTKFADNASAVNSAIYWRGRIAAAQDKDAKTGKAVDLYKQYLTATDSETERPKADLMQVYQYLAYYYYNQSDKANTVKYSDLILALEPGNKFATDLKGAVTKAPAPKAK